MGAETCLILAVPAADAVIGWWRSRLDPSAAAGIPAHLTLIYPFVPDDQITDEDLGSLASIFAAEAPIEFELASVGRFRDALYLAP
jgi:2'-5' RNA ligase